MSNSYRSVFSLEPQSAGKFQYEVPRPPVMDESSIDENFTRLKEVVKKLLDGNASLNDVRAVYDSI